MGSKDPGERKLVASCPVIFTLFVFVYGLLVDNYRFDIVLVASLADWFLFSAMTHTGSSNGRN